MSKNYRRDIYAGYFGFSFILLLTAITVGRLLINQEFTSPIGLLMREVNSIHVPMNSLNSGQISIMLVSFIVKAICATTICVTLLLAIRNFLHNDFFTTTNVKMFKIASWSALFYIGGQFFEGMANNWISTTEGISNNALPNGADDPGFIPMYILMMVLSMMTIALSRAVKLQEDQEGLI
ncbi:hypothetical protein WG915_04175 [Corynebacterium sp. H128]|uniref:hypothetical protein n=1 Tax=unclassified Corynebacterium TaxID=2624378 RepID=UPI0030A5303F